MKIVHTADWHLGKLVQGVYMTEDQSYILHQFITQMRVIQPDVIIIAGDVYDRALPPVEAVNLLNEIIAELTLALKIPVLSIAGNHDGPTRLQFGSELMQASGYHVAGELTSDIKCVQLEDEHGIVHFHLVPYAEPSQVRYAFQDDTIRTHQQAMQAIVNQIEQTMQEGERHIFVGHAFVTPMGQQEENTSDSERPLAIGGVEYVDAQLFENFNYVALGHLHKAHKVGSEHVRYAGSPLKYSASEHQHEKGYYIVTLQGDGNLEIEKQPLIPQRDLRKIKMTLAELLQQPQSDDYVFVQLLDEKPIAMLMEKVRTVFPNAMHVERIIATKHLTSTTTVQIEGLTDEQLFEAFYKEVNGKYPEEETTKLFQTALQTLTHSMREEANS